MLSEDTFHEVDGHLLDGTDCFYAEVKQCLAGFFADHRHLADGEGGHEGFFLAGSDLELVVWFCLTSSDFRNSFIDRKAERERKSGFADDTLPEFGSIFHTTEIAIHAAEIEVEFIDRSLLKDRYTFPDDIGDHIRVFGIDPTVSPDDDRFGAELSCEVHGHSGVYAKVPCFIAAGRDDTSVAGATDKDRFAREAAVKQALAGDEEGVQIDVSDGVFGTEGHEEYVCGARCLLLGSQLFEQRA